MTVQKFETLRVVQGREVLSVKEAAEVLSVSTVTISKYMKRGILDCVVLPSGVRQPTVEGVMNALALNDPGDE